MYKANIILFLAETRYEMTVGKDVSIFEGPATLLHVMFLV